MKKIKKKGTKSCIVRHATNDEKDRKPDPRRGVGRRLGLKRMLQYGRERFAAAGLDGRVDHRLGGGGAVDRGREHLVARAPQDLSGGDGSPVARLSRIHVLMSVAVSTTGYSPGFS